MHHPHRLNKEVTAAREALATLKPVQGAATPMMTPSHPQQPPTPSHEQAVAAQQASGATQVKRYIRKLLIFISDIWKLTVIEGILNIDITIQSMYDILFTPTLRRRQA